MTYGIFLHYRLLEAPDSGPAKSLTVCQAPKLLLWSEAAKQTVAGEHFGASVGSLDQPLHSSCAQVGNGEASAPAITHENKSLSAAALVTLRDGDLSSSWGRVLLYRRPKGVFEGLFNNKGKHAASTPTSQAVLAKPRPSLQLKLRDWRSTLLCTSCQAYSGEFQAYLQPISWAPSMDPNLESLHARYIPYTEPEPILRTPPTLRRG